MSFPISPPLSRRLLLLAPLAGAGLGCAAALELLFRMRQGTYDPRGLPSALIGGSLPDFALPGISLAEGGVPSEVTSAQMQAAHRPALLNFFASWCVPCVEEVPVLMQLKASGVPIYGIAYKDKPAATTEFLHRNGNPYSLIGSDRTGEVAIDFGLYGVPETYVVDAGCIVRLRCAGAINMATVRDSILPSLKAHL
jgi:cytochrome c biogenesis protein CcmG/thiol:disulfide interchange protein DsbE